MEIKYINTFEDIEFLIKYIQYKMGFSKYKYIVCSISVISGIYYSIKLQNLIYFFTNTVIMTFIASFSKNILSVNILKEYLLPHNIYNFIFFHFIHHRNKLF